MEAQCRGKAYDFGRRAGYVPPKGTTDIKGKNVGEYMKGSGGSSGAPLPGGMPYGSGGGGGGSTRDLNPYKIPFM